MEDAIDTGLSLSGGGYRAMLFNLGSVWRLNEMGWLRKVDMITSVSGGSILNGVLAVQWPALQWDLSGVATNFPQVIAKPVLDMASRSLDVLAGIEGLLSAFSGIADKVADVYDEQLFHGARLQQGVPKFEKGKTPRFLFYATSLQTGSSVRIERKRLADYRIGVIENPDLPLSRVVAASSAFPPVLSPVVLEVDPAAWMAQEGSYLFDRSDLKSKLLLTDGGVYDNMGLEAIWDRCKTVLVSDAGAPLDADPDPPRDWARQAVRVLDIVTEQTRALRKRALMQSFQQAEEEGLKRNAPPTKRGSYWGIRTKIAAYGVANPLAVDNEITEELQHVRTRLNQFKPREKGRLINWGYVLTDAAMRKYVDPGNAAASSLPVPEFPLT